MSSFIVKPRHLNEQGQCCGRKPLLYKRPHHHFFCTRCCAEFDAPTGAQIANWAWHKKTDGFEPEYPTQDYALKVKASA